MLNRGIKSHFKGELYNFERRTCRKCRVEKELDQFVKNKTCRYGRTHTCKKCNWRVRAPEFKRDRKRRADRENYLNRERKKIFVEWFKNKCHDCGSSFPDCVYDFHHIDPSKKDFKISYFRKRPDDLLFDPTILEELNKCVMLCANCHRIRHWDISDRTERKDGTG